jgi:MSHA biogenesis protein MshL
VPKLLIRIAITASYFILLNACNTPSIPGSANHIKDAPQSDGGIPKLVQQSASLSAPKPSAKAETYSVTVTNVPVQPLLFAIARDAKINVDIHPGIDGSVTLNALNQTLPQLLTRIAKQIDMRYELDGPNLVITPDSPFLHTYKVDYVNVSRNTASKVNIDTQITTTGGTGGGAGGNNSTTEVSNTSNNLFWETLVRNIKDILRETDKILPADAAETSADQTSGSTAANTTSTTANQAAAGGAPAVHRSTFREAASVIVNAETGLIAVRATSRQHEKIQEFLDLVLASAKRQVLIEATIIEVQLSDQYQQGINWSSLRSGAAGLNLTQAKIGSSALPSGVAPSVTPGLFIANYADPTSALGNIAATIQLLESFGKVKVLSSPKIGVLNNQTALLKVVDNQVYFTITATTTASTGPGIPAISTYTSDLHTVPVGFVMSVTPQIADTDEVTLNVRPSISRIISFVQDPNPALANAEIPVISSVPVIQTREMESILKITNGQVAVMGGLMQDSVNNLKDTVPLLGKIPLLGNLFSYRNETATKTELVIFLRPLVVKEPSLNGDFKEFRHFLRDENTHKTPPYEEPSAVTEPRHATRDKT